MDTEINISAKSTEIKISIVMAYHNRKPQTVTTLNQFQKTYAGKYNFEVIIVDDNSREEEKLHEILNNYSFYINYIIIDKNEKGENINPCVVYNKGFLQCRGEIIVIQNPECYHVGDILSNVLNMNENYYLSFSCYTANSFELTKELLTSSDIIAKINDSSFNQRNHRIYGLNWYNHPIYHPTGYHFCSAIHKSKLDLIGGFDTRFAEGYCFDDNEILLTIRHNLKLNVRIIPPDNVFVIHQFHEKNASFEIENKPDSNIIKRKWIKNKTLYDSMLESHKNNFQYPKLLHLYWDGSKMSYLNYLTIVSFNEYHKNWKIIVHMPTDRNTEIIWKTSEQKLIYNETCYFDKVKKVSNVIIKYINLNEIGFRNDAPEVIKSDYFRYYILQKHGGVWTDFDIIFTGSIEEKMNFAEDTVIFRCVDPVYGGVYYPIGLLIAKPNNKFFNFLMNEAKIRYSPNDYQSIGAEMLKSLFLNTADDILSKNLGTIKICNHEYYLPWPWNQLEEFLVKKDNILPDKNVGIHWFNGATQSKQFAIDLDRRLHDFNITCYLDKFISKYI